MKDPNMGVPFRQLAGLACRYEVDAALMNERSTQNVYRFALLNNETSPHVLKGLLLLAIKETDLVFGRTKRKLETNCRLFPRRTACMIEGGTECGEHLAKLLTGFLFQQVGDEGFRVSRWTRNGK
jgi:hypothetical protein